MISTLEAPVTEAATDFELVIPKPRLLTSQEELALTRRAVEQSPDSLDLRYSLATQLVVADRFEEALDLLRAWNLEVYRFLLLQATVLISHESLESNLAAKEATLRALAVSATPWQRSGALTTLAKLHVRLQQPDEARQCLREALATNKDDKDAYKRYIALELREDKPQDVLDFAERMVADGIAHARVVASQTLALARLGMTEEAIESVGLDRFLARPEPAPPAGYASLQEFNRALAAELESHPGTRFNRYGTASARTWRIDEPALQRSKIFPVLQQLIRREVMAYVATLPRTGHPFLAGRPHRARLRNWVVLTEGDGHETWHVHQNGWISGVYYVQVPDHIALGTGNEGCISFGLPAGDPGDAGRQDQPSAIPELIVRPRSGLMMFFPSHVYHRTFPHRGEGRRICCAFDIIPEA